jgi:hypothetical protein
MSLSEQILLLDNREFWIFACVFIAVAVGGFYFTFHFLRRARIIEDTPTASIRSAHQGYVELAGSAKQMDGEPILAPLTRLPCCWYSYKIERRGDKSWQIMDQGISDHLFLLQDDTGDCIIDPDGAKVTANNKDVWHGASRTPIPLMKNNLPSNWKLLLKLGQPVNRGISLGASYRYTETRIHDGDQLYGIGLFKTLDEVDHIQQRSEITRELLREWKKDRQSLLFEFDRNRDGKIDQQEWNRVREKAENQAMSEHQELIQGSVLHSLCDTGSNSHPLLLSTLAEFDLVRRCRRFAILSIIAFCAAGAAASWMLTLKLTN